MHRHAFEQILELNRAADFRENRECIWIPLDQCCADLHMVAFIDLELRAVHDRVAFLLAALFIHDRQDAVTIHRDEETFLVTNRLQLIELDRSGVLRFETGLLRNTAGRTADVERTHRELRSRFADRLRCDDTDSFTDFHQLSGCQVSSVAADAGTAAGLAGQNRTDLHALDTGGLDGAGKIFRDFLVDLDNHLAFVVLDLLERHAADDTISQGLDDFARFNDGADVNAVNRAAIALADDDILSDVHQTASEVTGVRRLQRRIRKALARTVCRDEVLLHRETFTEVRCNRRFDDFARGLGHQSAHTGELADLLF